MDFGGSFWGGNFGLFFPMWHPPGAQGAEKSRKNSRFFRLFWGPGPGAQKRLKNRGVLLGPILEAILGGILGAILGGLWGGIFSKILRAGRPGGKNEHKF